MKIKSKYRIKMHLRQENLKRSKGLFGYRLLLKTENWKYHSKIIFKYVNNSVGPSFKIVFAE